MKKATTIDVRDKVHKDLRRSEFRSSLPRSTAFRPEITLFIVASLFATSSSLAAEPNPGPASDPSSQSGSPIVGPCNDVHPTDSTRAGTGPSQSLPSRSSFAPSPQDSPPTIDTTRSAIQTRNKVAQLQQEILALRATTRGNATDDDRNGLYALIVAFLAKTSQTDVLAQFITQVFLPFEDAYREFITTRTILSASGLSALERNRLRASQEGSVAYKAATPSEIEKLKSRMEKSRSRVIQLYPMYEVVHLALEAQIRGLGASSLDILQSAHSNIGLSGQAGQPTNQPENTPNLENTKPNTAAEALAAYRARYSTPVFRNAALGTSRELIGFGVNPTLAQRVADLNSNSPDFASVRRDVEQEMTSPETQVALLKAEKYRLLKLRWGQMLMGPSIRESMMDLIKPLPPHWRSFVSDLVGISYDAAMIAKFDGYLNSLIQATDSGERISVLELSRRSGTPAQLNNAPEGLMVSSGVVSLYEYNARGRGSDEFMVYLSRSVYGREVFDRLITEVAALKTAEQKREGSKFWTGYLQRMEAAQAKAKELGDIPLLREPTIHSIRGLAVRVAILSALIDGTAAIATGSTPVLNTITSTLEQARGLLGF